MKTKEELEEIRKEVENLNKKLNELTEEELKEVTGGFTYTFPDGTTTEINADFAEYGFN